jgi:hypothetical protein
MQQKDSRIRLISGTLGEDGVESFLPCNSCMRQARVPTSSSAMPTTRHTPDSSPTALPARLPEGAMISGYPKQIARNLSIEVLVSVMLFNPALFVPFRFQPALQWPLFSWPSGSIC